MTSRPRPPSRLHRLSRLPRPPRAVLLDFDGTLSDSEAGIVEHLRLALRTVGLPVPSDELLRSCVGPPWEEGLDHIGVPPDRLHEVITTYRATYNLAAPSLTIPFPGVAEALTRLRGAGVHLAVATSKPQALVERIVAEGPLGGLVDLTVGAAPDAGRRTKADVVGAVLPRLPDGAGADGAVMVGDRRFDVEGAAAHGLPTVGVGWGAAPPGELEAAGAAAIVATPEALVDLLLAP